jgi:hypothetical protein
MNMLHTWPAVLCFAFAASASAQDRPRMEVGGDARAGVNVTVYNNNLALVRETRDVELPAGPVALRWMDVAAQIRPETVLVRPASGGAELAVLEQNYKYDVLNPTRLMELYVDRQLQLVTVNPGTGERSSEEATLLAAQGGQYVYRTPRGITFYHPGRVVLPEVPSNFVSRPTLEWLLDGRAPGRRTIEALYLTWGMTWNADYVLVLNEDDSRADITGWVTLRNDSGIGFDGASLQLVAGQVNVVTRDATLGWAREGRATTEAMPAGGPQFVEQGMFEYHLYTLQRPTDLMDREQKQIELLGADGVPIRKVFKLEGDSYYYVSQYSAPMENLPVSVWLEFTNAEADGMGMPLPAGTVRVYKADPSGGRQFLGEDAIEHTPREEQVELRIGEAFDVVAERRQTDYEVLSDTLYETEWEVKIRNRKAEAIVVEVREPMAGDWEILSSSYEWEKESARLALFRIRVVPDEEAILTYRVRTRY